MQNENDSDITIEYIIENYGRMVTAICRRMIQNKERAEDAAQEVWLEVAKNLKTFRGDSKVTTWLYTITSRVVMKLAKEEHQYSTSFLSNYYHGDDIEVPVYENFDKKVWVREMCDKCLTGTLHCLDNGSRLAFILRDIALVSYTEIAKILERNEEINNTFHDTVYPLFVLRKGSCELPEPAFLKCLVINQDAAFGTNGFFKLGKKSWPGVIFTFS